MRKHLFIAFSLFLGLIYLVSADTTSEIDMSLDGLFDEAEDIDVAESETPTPDLEYQSAINDSLTAIKFTGNLSSDIGMQQNIYPNFEFGTAGLTMDNDLSFASRTSDIFGVHGNFNTTFDDDGFTTEMDKFYFDYLLHNMYIKAGKRSITWGNTKHDWDDSDYIDNDILQDEAVTNDENIVEDNGDVSASISKYFGASDVEFLVMYDADWSTEDEVTIDALSFAGQSNIVIGSVATTLFGRFWAEDDDDYQNPVIGIEFNTSFLNFDFYTHNTLHFNIENYNIFDSWNVTSASFVIGTYRIWEDFKSKKMALNAEYALGWTEGSEHTNSFALDFVISHLFNNTSRLGVSWEYSEGNTLITPVYEYYDLEEATFDVALPFYYYEGELSVFMYIGLKFDLSY